MTDCDRRIDEYRALKKSQQELIRKKRAVILRQLGTSEHERELAHRSQAQAKQQEA